jgi:hypothetical protein
MATTTPNFGWPVPTSTDLVKDGATAIEALGDGVDASLVDLKGGTTGQVLAKTSATDLDFTWVTTDDANAIQNSIVDAKGDLISATANDTPARLAVGNNGETLVADSSATTGLRWQGNYAAGKNKIINGDFEVWQRGTSFSGTNQLVYTADRWQLNDFGGQVSNVVRSTFTPGTAPVAGYEGQFFATWSRAGAGTASSYLTQKVENVRTFAGQTVTFSFWAKASATESVDFYIDQNFGSGGSATVGSASTSFTLTTSWVRYTATLTLASISGKTVGTSSFLAPTFQVQTSQGAYTIDIWGVQLEAGSVATTFQTATGTIQGELAACQRYLPSYDNTGGNNEFVSGYAYGTNTSIYVVPFTVNARVAPTGITVSGTINAYALNVNTAVTPTFDSGGINSAGILASHTITAGQGSRLGIAANAKLLFTGCEL